MIHSAICLLEINNENYCSFEKQKKTKKRYTIMNAAPILPASVISSFLCYTLIVICTIKLIISPG